MVDEQMLCVVAPARAQDLDALRQKVDARRQALDELFERTGCVHFASIALLPPRPASDHEPSSPRLLLELALDDGVSPEDAIAALTDAAGTEVLWPLYEPHAEQSGDRADWLRGFLLRHTSRADGGFIGCRDRSVRQILDEARLFDHVRARLAVSGADLPQVDRRMLVAALLQWLLEQPAFAWVRTASPRSFWRSRWMTPKLHLALASASFGLPVLLLAASVLGLLAVAGVVALVAGVLLVGVDAVLPNVFGPHRWQAGAALVATILIGLLFVAVVALGASKLLRVSVTFGLLLMLGALLSVFLVWALWLAPFAGAMRVLMAWGGAVTVEVLVIAIVVLVATLLAPLLVPRQLGAGAVGIAFVALLLLAAFGAHRGLTWLVDHPWQWNAAAAAVLRGRAWYGLPAIDVVALLAALLALAFAAFVAVYARRVVKWADAVAKRDTMKFQPIPRPQRTHASIDACEADLIGKPNHMISVTEIRRPRWLMRALLRCWLWLVTRLGHVYFTHGRLGDAAGIKFGHWHVIDNGRRLLFCSNYDGSFGGYLDEFIFGASQGVNLFWRWTELKRRAPAGPGHPAVLRDRDFPTTRLWMFHGCWHEQWFKAYARDSMIPHLYRYAAYRETNLDIERATRLRDALAGERSPENDDSVMRALES